MQTAFVQNHLYVSLKNRMWIWTSNCRKLKGSAGQPWGKAEFQPEQNESALVGEPNPKSDFLGHNCTFAMEPSLTVD